MSVLYMMDTILPASEIASVIVGTMPTTTDMASTARFHSVATIVRSAARTSMFDAV